MEQPNLPSLDEAVAALREQNIDDATIIRHLVRCINNSLMRNREIDDLAEDLRRYGSR